MYFLEDENMLPVMTEGTSEPHISGVLMPSHQILGESAKANGVSHITFASTMIGEVVKGGIYHPLTDILPHMSTTQTLDSTCAMYTAAIPADIAGNLPEGTVFQIMPDTTVLTVASVKGIPKSAEVSSSSVICTDEELKAGSCNNGQETEQCFSSVQNLNTETSEQNNTSVIELAGSSEGNVSDLDLSFLNEPEDAGTISDSQVQPVEQEIQQGLQQSLQDLPSNQLPSTETADSCNSMVSEADPNLVDMEQPDSSVSNPQPDPDSSVVVIDVSKPIQLSQNSLIVVNGQKCVLQHDSQTGQVVAYPVKEPEKPKRKRGRPRKIPVGETSQSDKPEVAAFSGVETEDVSEEDAVEKGLLEVVTDDGAVVRRSSRKRKKAKTLKDYETGNLKQELGSDIDENDSLEKEENSAVRKRGKQRGPGRPRKYPVPSASVAVPSAQNSGRKPRGRPRHYVPDKEATQAFLIQTASGQNLMMHVPLSSIPPGMSLQDVAQGIANSLNLAVSQNSVTDPAATQPSPPPEAMEVPAAESACLPDSSGLPEDQTSNASLHSGISLNDEVPTVNSEQNTAEIIAPCLQDHIVPGSDISFEQIESLREMSMDSSDGFVNNTPREILSSEQPVATESSSETTFNVINPPSRSVQVEDELNTDVICTTQEEEIVQDDNNGTHFIKINMNKTVPSVRNSIISVTTANNATSDSSTVFTITSDCGVTHFRLCDGNEKKVVKEVENSETNPVNSLSLDQSDVPVSLNNNVTEGNFKPDDFVQSSDINESVECSTVNQAEGALDSLLASESSSDAVAAGSLVNNSNDGSEDMRCSSPKKYENITSTSFEITPSTQTNVAMLAFDSTMGVTEQQSVEHVADDMQESMTEPAAEIGNIVNDIAVDVSSNNQTNNSSPGDGEIDDCSVTTSAETATVKEDGIYTFAVNDSEAVDGPNPQPDASDISATSIPEKRKRGRPRKYPIKPNTSEKPDNPLPVGFEFASLQDVTSLLNHHAGTLPEIASSVSSITGTPATVIPLPEKMLPMLLPKPNNLLGDKEWTKSKDKKFTSETSCCTNFWWDFTAADNNNGMSSGTPKKLDCLKCDYHADNEYMYQQHLLSHPDDTKHCKCCKFLSFTEEELIEHFKDKHPRCICSVCNHMAEHAYIIKRHLYRHTEDGCMCEICGGKYKDHYILKTHIKMVHMPADTLYQCHMCEKKFTRKAHLKRHLRTHNPDKPYKCAHCDYRGCEKSDITKHMLVHEEPKHNCEMCKKTFRHIKNKELHMKRHKGQKDFKCGICDFFGYTVTDIKKHIERRHLDTPKTIACTKCGRACASQEALKEHQDSNQCETYLLEQIFTEKYEENGTAQVEADTNVKVEVSTEAAAAALSASIAADSSQEVHHIPTVTLEDGTVAALNTGLTTFQNGQIILGNVGKVLETTENGEIILRTLEGSDLLSSGYLAILSSSGEKNTQLAVVTSEESPAKIPDSTTVSSHPDAIKDALQEVCSPEEIKDLQKPSDSSVQNLIINGSVLNEYHDESVPHSAPSSS